MNISESEDLGPFDTQANKRSNTLTERKETSCPITDDLIIEIFSRLPAKSIARCRCLAKRWASLLLLPYFTDLFLTKSSTRPKLLFVYEMIGRVLFFSSPQPQSLDENSSLLTTKMEVPYHKFYNPFDVRFSCTKGLVLILTAEHVLKGCRHMSFICNPSTGQVLVLPKVKTRRKVGVRSYFGYDPVEKQHKVLSMTWLSNGNRWLVSEEHQVLTLGRHGGTSGGWRKIECTIPHTLNYKDHNVCIDGVVYYSAKKKSTGSFIIVCFDVRSEKFSFIKDTEGCALLINYNGKVASLGPEESINGSFKSIRLRVLEDVEKEEWSERIYMLPDVWKDVVGKEYVSFVGVTRRNEIVLKSSSSRSLVYFNTERNTVIRVGILGVEAVNHHGMFTFQDHVEDVTLMEGF